MRSSFPTVRDARVFAFGIALSFVGAIAARYAIRGYRFTHPPRVVVTADESARARAALPGLEDITLHTEDGLSLRGWFSPGNRGAAVILVSGLGSNRAQLESDALVFGRHGYGVLTFDSRACGESDGNLVTWGDRERLDARAAVDYVRSRHDIDPRRIAILGHSVGASTVAMEASSDPRVGAVILYATWTSLEDEMKANMGRWGALSWGPLLLTMRAFGVRPRNVTPIEHVRDIAPRPLLMITGTADDDTPVSIMQRVFAAAGDPKDLWVVDGAGHGEYLATAPVEYERRVIAFLERAFPSSSP